MNNAVRSFSAVSPALHPSIRLVLFHFKLYTFFFSLAYVSSQIPSFFRCSGSTDAISLSEQCESHIAFPGITFTYLFGAHTYPSHPFSSVFLSNVFSPLRIHFPLFDLLLFFFIDLLLFFSYRPFSQSIYLVIDVNQQSARVFILLSFNVYVSPTPSICCARQNITLRL